jgi:hypothetical protein
MPESVYKLQKYSYEKKCSEYGDDCHMCAVSGCVPTSKGCDDAKGYIRTPLAIKDFVRNSKMCVD